MNVLSIRKDVLITAMTETFCDQMGIEKGGYYPFLFRSFYRPDANLTLLTDVEDENALLVNKVDIAEIFDFDIDISAFETNRGVQDVSYQDVKQAIDDAGIEVTLNTANYPNSLGGHRKEEAVRFYTFLKVYGIEGIEISHVYLSLYEEILTISMKQEHPFYKGMIKVKTW